MPSSHTIKTTHAVNGVNANGSETISGSTEVNASPAVPAGATNQLVPFSLTAAGAQELFLLASVDLTVKTNSTGSPGNTWALKAGIPFIWSRQAGYYANPIAADIAALYVTNAGATSTTLYARGLQN